MSNQNKNDYEQKYTDLGNQIKDSVMNAVNSGDFSGLSDSIGQSVHIVLGDVGDAVNKAASQAISGTRTEGQRNFKAEMNKARETAERYHREQEAEIERNKLKRSVMVKKPNQVVKYNDVGRVSNIIKLGLGIVGVWKILPFTISALFKLLQGMAVVGSVAVGVIFTFACGYLIIGSLRGVNLSAKAKKYKSLCSEKMYCAIDDIASATGTEQKKVVKNIKRMLEKGFFPEGYLDDEKKTFIVSTEVYNQYRATKQNVELLNKTQLEESGVAEEKVSGLSGEQQTELNNMMTEGRRGIERIHELNDIIPGESISNKLDRLESLLNEIFDRVREHPEQMKECHRLMDYYLPTMIKLVEAYAEYDKVSEPGPDILNAKDEIEKTLDTINKAFVELLNKLFRDSVWDVTADAKVLKTMLQQEGLADDVMNSNE